MGRINVLYRTENSAIDSHGPDGAYGALPSWTIYWQLADAGRGAIIAFSCVPSGDHWAPVGSSEPMATEMTAVKVLSHPVKLKGCGAGSLGTRQV